MSYDLNIVEEELKNSISVDWDKAKQSGVIDADFYLADLLSENNLTLIKKLFVILKTDHYELKRNIDKMGFLISKTAHFYDKQKSHKEFWKKYQRPPKEEHWDYIINRRDLLVSPDIRSRKGSFFTPQIWDTSTPTAGRSPKPFKFSKEAKDVFEAGKSCGDIIIRNMRAVAKLEAI